MKIRLIHEDECDILAQITLRAYRALNGTQPIGRYEEELLAVDRRRRDSEVYVAVDDDGRVLGGVTYVPGPQHAMAEFHDPDACGIRMLAVDPGAQGRGVGRALVTTCIERANEQHRARIILHSAPPMTRAQSMYVRMGFSRASELDEWFREDSDHDELLHLTAYVYNS
ncbi:MAG TPA: GNAT family N-acetyltransferase [Acidimicrobiales bacterium]